MSIPDRYELIDTLEPEATPAPLLEEQLAIRAVAEVSQQIRSLNELAATGENEATSGESDETDSDESEPDAGIANMGVEALFDDPDAPEINSDTADEAEQPDKAKPNVPLDTDNNTAPLDALQLFLENIGEVPLLTAAQEVELAKQIEPGEKARVLLKKLQAQYPNGNMPAAAAHLEEIIEKSWPAKQKMVKSNLRLVVFIAKNYRNQGLSFLDLIQEGTIGLNRAVEKFDWRRGYKFSTYATWWIRQACTRALANKSRTIKMPFHIVEKHAKIVRSIMLLRGELGREPEYDEIAKDLGFKVEDVDAILRAAQTPASLDKLVGGNADTTFGSLMADESGESVEATVERTALEQSLEGALQNLSSRQRLVVKLHHGLNGNHPCTLDEIGEMLGVTRERARQIEAEAFKKLQLSNPELRDLIS